MKKISKLMMLLALGVVLVACNGKETKKENKVTRAETKIVEETKETEKEYETTVYTGENNGVISEFTFYHEGDLVIKQTAKNIMNYEKLGIPNAESLKAQLEPASKQYQGVKGITESIEYGDKEAIETVEIDYLNIDYEAAKNIPGVTFDGDPSNRGVSLKKSTEMFAAQGYIKK